MFNFFAQSGSLFNYNLDHFSVDKYNKDSDSSKTSFNNWVKRNLNSHIPLLNNVAKTYFNWSYEIKNSLEVPYTNGVIEGFNNKIKTLKRIAFGFRNFKRFRTRILLLT